MESKRKYFLIPIAVLAMFVITRCSGEEQTEDPVVNDIKTYPAQIVSPANESNFVRGDKINVELEMSDPESVNDLQLLINDELYKSLDAKSQTVAISTADFPVGWVNIKITYTDDKGDERSDFRKAILFSDTKPEELDAIIVGTYPHAKTSYTQGLEFYNDRLFEGTGQRGQSILAEVDLKTGTPVRQHALAANIFGEGITILKDKIYQITYQAGVCYQYNMDFELLNTFEYSGEGWGLTNDGTHLIMSNGSYEIVWRNPETFEVEKKIYVFDHESSILRLNELELIEGDLYANVYTTDNIVVVDTATGIVLKEIYCGRLTEDASEAGNDVLNGIAHNPNTGKTYMTGKWWSKLYEVSFE